MDTRVITTLRERINNSASKWPARQRAHHSRRAMILALTMISLALATPGFARSSTAYNLFKIQYPFTPSQGVYDCMREDFGAVRNDCGVTVYLMFDLAIDNTSSHEVDVWNYWFGTGTTGVTCSVWTYDHSGSGRSSGELTFNPIPTNTNPPNGIPPNQELTFFSKPVQDTQAITLFCTVPPTQGIASVNWSQ